MVKILFPVRRRPCRWVSGVRSIPPNSTTPSTTLLVELGEGHDRDRSDVWSSVEVPTSPVPQSPTTSDLSFRPPSLPFFDSWSECRQLGGMEDSWPRVEHSWALRGAIQVREEKLRRPESPPSLRDLLSVAGPVGVVGDSPPSPLPRHVPLRNPRRGT